MVMEDLSFLLFHISQLRTLLREDVEEPELMEVC